MVMQTRNKDILETILYVCLLSNVAGGSFVGFEYSKQNIVLQNRHLKTQLNSYLGLLQSNNLIKNENPAVSLKNVCKWAHRMYETDPPPHRRSPDHSIFLTRKNFGPAGEQQKYTCLRLYYSHTKHDYHESDKCFLAS